MGITQMVYESGTIWFLSNRGTVGSFCENGSSELTRAQFVKFVKNMDVHEANYFRPILEGLDADA